jgi:hypothetical protein
MRNATIDRPGPSLSSCHEGNSLRLWHYRRRRSRLNPPQRRLGPRATLQSEVVTRGRHGMAYTSTVVKIGMLVETGVVPDAFVFRKAEEGHDNATRSLFKAFRRIRCRSLGSVVRPNFGSNSENAL